MKIKVPPIKSQGIKTKLVPWIKSIVPSDFNGLWIEPFMGTCVVCFNIKPKHALLCDTNPHLVNFYNSLLKKDITPDTVRYFLNTEGSKLSKEGESYYYKARERFNKEHNPLDFLFLNRACFNGMIRFNSSGKFNVPFCRKTNRFSKSYITKIANQVSYVYNLLISNTYTFKQQSFEKTI